MKSNEYKIIVKIDNSHTETYRINAKNSNHAKSRLFSLEGIKASAIKTIRPVRIRGELAEY